MKIFSNICISFGMHLLSQTILEMGGGGDILTYDEKGAWDKKKKKKKESEKKDILL